ncbi:ATP-dependent DNA helicase [Trichonephila clavipes]|nr:ATP-dependent DNA helicase [Trichonephila clavipes]
MYDQDIPSATVNYGNNRVHKIEPRSVQFPAKLSYGTAERRMLPLILSWASTIRRMQVSTVDYAVIYLALDSSAKEPRACLQSSNLTTLIDANAVASRRLVNNNFKYSSSALNSNHNVTGSRVFSLTCPLGPELMATLFQPNPRSEVETKECRSQRLRGSVPASCQVIYSPFGLAIHQNDHQARRRFVEWAQNEIAVVPDFHKRILFSDEAHFWWNGYVNKQNCRIWSEANPQVYVETPLHPEKLTVWCALWAGGILLQKR